MEQLGVLGREQILAQIERLVNSKALHKSEALCKLLRYLAQHSLDNPEVPPKEYTIATEVFGRSPEYDPQVDSTTRVQAGRLRAKLASYYATEGTNDPIIVDLPKGSYALQFEPRHHADFHSTELVETEPPMNGHVERNGTRNLSIVLGVLLAVAIAWIVALMTHRPDNATLAAEQQAPAAFSIFWDQFAKTPEHAWVVFSNAAFIGRPETGMRYYNAGKDPEQRVWDHYTGVGEVLAVHDLDVVFATLHSRVRVKRGSLFTLDDLKQNELIFLGSPSENLTLREIPTTQHFRFQRVASGPREGDLGIFTDGKTPGAPEIALATPSGQSLSEDYAVIGLLSGPEQGRSVLVLAGTTTFGTQAAVEYVCRQDSLEQLLDKLSVHKPEDLKPFEALLHVKIAHGVPVEMKLIALHKSN
jgi:hypothetical protein